MRDLKKAQILFGNFPNIEIIEAELSNKTTLKKGLSKTSHLYLNLSTNTTNLQTSFSAEREGIENILDSIDKNTIKQIIHNLGIGGTG